MNDQCNLENLDSKVMPIFTPNKFSFETQKMKEIELKMIMQDLNYISFQIDPYTKNELKPKELELLKKYKLLPIMDNPFEFTNAVLQMIDSVETQLKHKLH